MSIETLEDSETNGQEESLRESQAQNSASRSVAWVFARVRDLWRRTLRRRSQRAYMNWEKMRRLVDLFFPPIRILHPLPCHRFDARTRGRSPVR